MNLLPYMYFLLLIPMYQVHVLLSIPSIMIVRFSVGSHGYSRAFRVTQVTSQLEKIQASLRMRFQV